jgi:hypothetical protein
MAASTFRSVFLLWIPQVSTDEGHKSLLSYSVRLLKATFRHWLEDKAKRHCRNTDNETAKHSRIGARLQNVKVAIFQLFAHAFRGYILNATVCQIQV